MKRIFSSLLFVLYLSLSASLYAQISPTSLNKTASGEQDARYLAPLPEEGGKVYLVRDITLSEGSKTDDVMQKLQTWLDRCMQDPDIIQHKDIPTTEEQTLQQLVIHTITFSDRLLALDQMEMTYVLSASLKGNTIQLKMSHISYKYNGEDPDRKMLRYTAEDRIADSIALYKDNTKLVPGYRKYRIKTVDLMDAYLNSLKSALWIQ